MYLIKYSLQQILFCYMFWHLGAILREFCRSKEYGAPPATTHFTVFIWTRSLLIAKTETDVCLHTAQRI